MMISSTDGRGATVSPRAAARRCSTQSNAISLVSPRTTWDGARRKWASMSGYMLIGATAAAPRRMTGSGMVLAAFSTARLPMYSTVSARAAPRTTLPARATAAPSSASSWGPRGDGSGNRRSIPMTSGRHPADYTAKQGDEGGWLGASGLSARHPEDKFFPGRAHHIGKRGLFQAKPEHAPRPTVRPVVDGNEDRTRMRRVVDRTRHSPGLRHRQDLDGDQSRLVGVTEIAQVEDASLAAIEHDLEHVKAALEHLMNPVFPGPM